MYLWTKLLHVAAVIAFLGNIATGLFWHLHAARTRDPRLLALAQVGVAARFDYAAYHRLARRWEIWGAAALLTPVAGLVLMVLKPAL